MNDWIEVGTVKQLNRFPVKSMRGQSIDESHVYWYGFDGDRRYAFVRSEIRSGFPWLTGRDVPEIVQYTPTFVMPDDVVNSAVEVTTPNGRSIPIHAPELQAELAEAYGKAVHLIKINRGAFDAQQLSMMSVATGIALSDAVGMSVSADRFRQNIIIDTKSDTPFQEETWLNRVVTFGTESDAVRVRINRRIQRCVMVTIDPETAVKSPAVLRTVA
ncbi:MAG: MOSC domain-containing protein, partial [Chloroflexi bacterium]|nr:MOSC domain-containing protein [Chloroflexota bacterium]